MSQRRIDRRAVLHASGVAIVGAVAGCSNPGEDGEDGEDENGEDGGGEEDG